MTSTINRQDIDHQTRVDIRNHTKKGWRRQDQPLIKVMAVSNVYSRMMLFRKEGDIECGHKHTYDHTTIVSKGSVLIEIHDDKGNLEASKIFKAPTMVYINKDKEHTLTALEDDTLCICVHALRLVDEEIIDPDFLIEPLSGEEIKSIRELSIKKYGEELPALVKGE